MWALTSASRALVILMAPFACLTPLLVNDEVQALEAGRVAFEARNGEAALRRLLPLARKGNSGAEYMVAKVYELGSPYYRGVKQDETLARRHYLHAARIGHRDAQSAVGFSHLKGLLGFKYSTDAATYWFCKAGLQASEDAVANLDLLLAGWQTTCGLIVEQGEQASWYSQK